MPDEISTVRIRMYRPGLGDCFLLTFGNGNSESHILIDCGTFVGSANEKKRMREIVSHIKETTGGRLQALAATHEHWDHVAGFHYARDIFEDFTIDEIWLAWTEDPDQQIARERRHLKANLEQALAMAVQRLTNTEAMEDQECGRAIADVMAFNGPSGGLWGAAGFAKRSNTAMEYVTGRKKASEPFLEPGDLLTRPWLPGVRVYVLGPPKNLDCLGELEGSQGTDQYAAAMGACNGWLAGIMRASGQETGFDPEDVETASRLETFDNIHRWTEAEFLSEGDGMKQVIASYRRDDWRRIDSAWYNNAANLALQLDNFTNNTSLVLAFELVDSRQVLLFVGDAQIGNWQSWDGLTWNLPEEKRTVATRDLLERTVFYKVGHHGSINATRKKNGLELMTSPHLVAALPTDTEFSDKQKGWEMPAPKVEKALLEKTRGRLLRSDSYVFPENSHGLSEAGWQAFRSRVKEEDNPLFVDYVIEA